MTFNTLSYRKIKEVYSNKTAKRSKVPLINHINEGLLILDYLEASPQVKDAFCLHPLFQDTEQLLKTIEDSTLSLIEPKTLILVMEYRHVANSFLSNNHKENCLPLINEDMRYLLIADKVQNYKDFILYHKASHKNSERLDAYFNEWFSILGIDYSEVSFKVFK